MSDAVQCVWFKRDLRLFDHAPLVEAVARGQIVPVYVIEPEVMDAPDFDALHWGFSVSRWKACSVVCACWVSSCSWFRAMRLRCWSPCGSALLSRTSGRTRKPAMPSPMTVIVRYQPGRASAGWYCASCRKTGWCVGSRSGTAGRAAGKRTCRRTSSRYLRVCRLRQISSPVPCLPQQSWACRSHRARSICAAVRLRRMRLCKHLSRGAVPATTAK